MQELSRQTGVAVADGAAAFQRFSIAAKDIGATNNQVLELVAGIQKFGIVGGASMQQTEAATMQLGQALASGRLQGDELRSILENMPDFARALAKELGTSTGGLREMGAAGKLSSDVVFPAILRAAEGIDEVFQKMPVTMARAQQQYDAAAQSFMGHLDQSLGLSDKLIWSLQRAAGLVNDIRRATGGATRDERVASLGERQTELTNKIAEFDRQQPTGPVDPATQLALQNNGDYRARLVADLKSVRADLLDINNKAVREEEAQQAVANENSLAAARSRSQAELDEVKKRVDRAFGINKQHEDNMDRLRRGLDLGTTSKPDFDRLAALSAKERDDALKGLAGHAQEATKHVSELDAVLQKLRDKQSGMARSIEAELDPVAAAYQRLGEQVRKINDAVGLGLINSDRGEALKGMAWNGMTKSLENLDKDGKKVDETFNRFFANATSGFEEAIVRGERFGNVVQALTQDIARMVLRLTVTGPALEAISGLGLGGIAKDFFNGVFSATSGASYNPAVTTSGIAVPFADGGIMSSRGRVPLKRYAAGGIADTPQTAYFGEGSTPEAYVPLADGRSIPVTVSGGGGTTIHAPITVNVANSNSSPAVIAATVRQAVGEALGRLIDDVNRGGNVAKIFGRRR